MVRGKKEDAVSELEAGRRTIVRDPDDPVQQANILDNLMISREEDIEEELRAAYMPVRAAAASSAVMAMLETGYWAQCMPILGVILEICTTLAGPIITVLY